MIVRELGYIQKIPELCIFHFHCLCVNTKFQFDINGEMTTSVKCNKNTNRNRRGINDFGMFIMRPKPVI